MLVCRGYTFSAICRGYVISSPFITGFWGPILEVYCHFFSNNKQSIDLNSFKSLFRISAFKYRTSASKSFHVLDVAHLQVAVFPKNQGIPTERCHYDESNLLITVLLFFLISKLYKCELSTHPISWWSRWYVLSGPFGWSAPDKEKSRMGRPQVGPSCHWHW